MGKKQNIDTYLFLYLGILTPIRVVILVFNCHIMFYKQHILNYQYYLCFDNIAHKYTDDGIV